ncbi:MAG: nuclear transport factor 2 family protein [Bacteroidia bacterium]|nr:nuclear transport factor 2 family protein [Bacteroidia bacterium]
MSLRPVLLVMLMVLVQTACRDGQKMVEVTREIAPGSDQRPDAQIRIVDEFYLALTGRDSAGVVSRFDENAKMMGTDPLEDWGLDSIKQYMSDRMRDTTRKAVFTVKKRDVRVLNEVMYVCDVLDVSTIKVPFRCLTITRKKDGVQKIVFAEFSALVKNADMRKLEAFY